MAAKWIMFLILLLTACSGEPTFVQSNLSSVGNPVRIYYATLRSRVENTNIFGSGRANKTSYGQLDISVPVAHKVGAIEWPNRNPDPEQHFLVTQHSELPTASAFLHKIQERSGPVTIFVHGFNTSFPEAVFRHAQIAHDYELSGDHIQFSWPSKGLPSGYLYDRDSALSARDTLAVLVASLVRDQPRQVTLVGHSMGAFLIMETLRQLSLSSDIKTLTWLNRVILISPDVDETAFLTQLQKIKPRPKNLTVVVNSGDLSLSVSGRLSGGASTRVGSGRDQAVLRAQGVSVVDLSGIEDGDSSGHFLAATSPTAIAFLRSLQPAQ